MELVIFTMSILISKQFSPTSQKLVKAKTKFDFSKIMDRLVYNRQFISMFIKPKFCQILFSKEIK